MTGWQNGWEDGGGDYCGVAGWQIQVSRPYRIEATFPSSTKSSILKLSDDSQNFLFKQFLPEKDVKFAARKLHNAKYQYSKSFPSNTFESKESRFGKSHGSKRFSQCFKSSISQKIHAPKVPFSHFGWLPNGDENQ